MAEAIHCPSCSTRYRLRSERLRPAIRRAQCFSCGGVFPVGDIVVRLLVPEAPAAFDPIPDMGEIADLQPLTGPPSLTLGDLDGADAEILEKTLVDVPASLPEAPVEASEEAPAPSRTPAPAPAFPAGITDSTLSGYTSARDAIDKLFGDTPAPSTVLKISKDPSSTDMEATLTALEATLSGAMASALRTGSDTAGDSPTASGRPDGAKAASSATVRLSVDDLRAALAATPAEAPSFHAAGPTVAPEERTEVLPPPPRPSPLEAFAAASVPDTGIEVLRLKIGEEIYPGLTMPQLIAWVEEGRILESHLVARQHSENWLEAHKVPGLRPVFERLRRERSTGAPSLDPAGVDSTQKKSLFGGLFGKA